MSDLTTVLKLADELDEAGKGRVTVLVGTGNMSKLTDALRQLAAAELERRTTPDPAPADVDEGPESGQVMYDRQEAKMALEAKVRELCAELREAARDESNYQSTKRERDEAGRLADAVVAELVALCRGPSAEAVAAAERVSVPADQYVCPEDEYDELTLVMAREILRLAGAAPTEGK